MLGFLRRLPTNLFDVSRSVRYDILSAYELISDDVFGPWAWTIDRQVYYDMNQAFEAWWESQNFGVPFSENPITVLVVDQNTRQYTLKLYEEDENDN